MKRKLALLASIGSLIGTVTLSAGAFAASPSAVVDKDICKDGNWTLLFDDNYDAFKNQGACISFVNHGGRPVYLPD